MLFHTHGAPFWFIRFLCRLVCEVPIRHHAEFRVCRVVRKLDFRNLTDKCGSIAHLIDGKHYAFHALRVDIGESIKFHKIENGDIDFVTKVIEKHFKHSDTLPQGLKSLDSVKDSVTVREVIESLVAEETSAIASYNVALETLKDHIPAEAYEAIKAIRDDEQRHVENLYAVLNGDVTSKNLEN